jgi:hypothetical protein
VGAESIHAERQTDMAKRKVAFHNFAKTSKMIFFGRKSNFGVLKLLVLEVTSRVETVSIPASYLKTWILF